VRGAPDEYDFSKTQDLARRLLAFEAAHDNSSATGVDGAARVIEELRLRLIKLAGVDGFRALLSRALTLAKAEVPSLNMVQVSADGSLEGFEGIEQAQGAGATGPAGMILVAHLLELLLTFIGEPLTLRLVRDNSPDASMDRAYVRTEENHERANKVSIQTLPTGVPGLDEILGGGLPEFSFNIIAGAPGGGKTTLAHQMMFANATPERPALYFTVLGEPAIKMLRYQQQFEFFDQTKMNTSVHFINLSQVVLDQDLNAVLEAIVKEVEATSPGIVVVDSFRTVVRKAHSGATDVELQGFIQRLALYLTSWQATTFLIGEYDEGEIRDNPIFTVADGLFWLSQQIERNSIVRKLQIRKSRGQSSVPGCTPSASPTRGCKPSRALSVSTTRKRNPGAAATFERRPRTGRDDGRGIPEGTVCCWQESSGRGSRCWVPSSSSRASGRVSRGLWRCLRNAPESTRNGPPALVSI